MMVRLVVLINAMVAALLAGALLVYPSARAFLNIRDPALQKPGIPAVAWRLERNLTPRYAQWAAARVHLGRAKSLSQYDVSGTEWPLFGSVFYLWAVENLQAAWNNGDHTAGVEPKVFCRDAIVAASELVVDPGHAAWVMQHWGTNYLHEENIFYRMLVIAALTSRAQLLHDSAHLDLLRDQVETLASEINRSRSGLLNDYPGECYPGDVMAAIMCIRRADAILGADHSKFVLRSLRAFTGRAATRHKLPPYAADAATGAPLTDARGCGNSYMCLTAPELWPGPAKTWFDSYEKYFWQERLGFRGFREFAEDVPKSDWAEDVDAGPVIDGFGMAADAFGVGAARKNGRFDLAYPLSAEMLATVWELPNGRLVLPRELSNLSDAPMLGEAGILWLLTVQPEKGFPIKSGGSVPIFVYATLLIAFLLGLLGLDWAYGKFRAVIRGELPVIPAPYFQSSLWLVLIIAASVTFWQGHTLAGLAWLLAAQFLPRAKRKADDANWQDDQPKAPASARAP